MEFNRAFSSLVNHKFSRVISIPSEDEHRANETTNKKDLSAYSEGVQAEHHFADHQKCGNHSSFLNDDTFAASSTPLQMCYRWQRIADVTLHVNDPEENELNVRDVASLPGITEPNADVSKFGSIDCFCSRAFIG